MKSGLHILFHRPTPWDSAVQCSTKILAKRFSESGHEVTYLEDPLDPIHILKWRGYFDIWRRTPRWEGRIWVISAFSMIPLRDFVPFNTQLSLLSKYLFCMPTLRSLIRRSGRGQPDVIWTTVPGSRYLRRVFPNAKFVFHVVDYYPAFRGQRVEQLEKMDYLEADRILLIGDALRAHLERLVGLSKVTVLGQGVEIEKYQEVLEEPRELRDLPRPRAIWCGVSSKLDRGLLAATAQHLSLVGATLVIIGDIEEWLLQLSEVFPETLVLLGPRDGEVVPAYLQNCDIGLMLYDRAKREVYKGQNPLKLYEYAAAGLVVISTPHDEYRFLDPPVILVEREEDLRLSIQRAIDEVEVFRSSSLQFAEQHSWASKLDDSMMIVEELLQ